jgi:hypothetical protein
VINTRGIGPFSGHIAADRDTEDGVDDARDGRDEEARDDDDDDRDREAGDDRAPAEWWERSSFDG